ncbi:hypothetical protein [Kitasatospora sp. NPDC089509]|uniref:hypothetical protein n=1 Tax=Kitasatospora sp. NPDC089509 TaxID=3364079 RepID=UPI003817B786
MPSNVNLVWRPEPNARPSYPFDDELVRRDLYNLDKLNRPEGIGLSRHHVIPYNTLMDAWNSVVENEYNNKKSALAGELRKFAKAVAGKLGDLRLEARFARNIPRIRNFAEEFSKSSTRHDPSKQERLEGWDDFLSIFAWLPGNLFVGPEGARRADEPADGFEAGSAGIVGAESLAQRRQVYDRLDRYLMNPNSPGMKVDAMRGIRDLAQALDKNGLRPVREADWKREKQGDKLRFRIKPLAEHAVLMESDTRPRRDLPRGSASPSVPTLSGSAPNVDAGITIDGVSLQLAVQFDQNGYVRRRAHSAGIQMGALLNWIASKWGVSDGIPKGLRDLTLQYLTVDVLTGPGGLEEWEFTAATEARFSGAVMDLLFFLRRRTPSGGGAPVFSVSADAGVTIGHGDEPARLWFRGGVEKTSVGAWELNASAEATSDALTLTQLLSAAGTEGSA